MKHFYKFSRMIAATAVIVLSSIVANAAVEAEGLWWELDAAKLKATIVAKPDGTKYSGDIVIPETITIDGATYTLSTTTCDQFNNCPDLTSIVFKGNLRVNNLKYNPRLKRIEWALQSASFAQLAINQGLAGCDSLETFIFPQIMRGNATAKFTLGTTFQYMKNLKTVKLPSNPTIISDKAFFCSANLSSINLENVTAIGTKAFCYTALETIDLSNAPLLGNNAFDSNYNLTNIIFPDSVSLGYNFYDTEQGYKANNVFAHCNKLESVKLPQGMTEIPIAFFYDCNKLSNVEFSDSIKIIRNAAFANCVSFNKPQFKEGLEIIEERAFISGISDLIIPSTLKQIGDNNLNPRMLKSVTIAEGNNHFMIKNNTLYSKDNKKIYCAIYGSLEVDKYPGITELKDDLVEEVGSDAFRFLPITSYDFPALKKVGEDAFSYTDLTSVTIKKDVEYGTGAFAYCDKLTNATIENGVTKLSRYLFQNSGLTSVPKLPQSLKEIGSYCFGNCKITDVTIKKSITYGDGVFRNNPISKVSIEDGVTSLSYYLFESCESLKTAPVLPRSLVKVNEGVFNGCKFTEITLPCNLTYFANNFLPETVSHIVCANPIPPIAQYYEWDETYDAYLPNTTLEVPLESVDDYKNHPFWGRCKEIIGSAALSVEQPNKSLPHGIYYAVKGGNICYTQDEETFDTGIASGAHPFNMQYFNNGIYVSDAGESHYYSPEDISDGELFIVESFDNSFLKTQMGKNGGHAYDPYTCWIDTITGTLYSCGRNYPVYSIDLNNHNWYPYNYSYLLDGWQYLPYYNRSLAYGSIPRGIQKDSNGVYWMPFCFNGNGIIRFKDSDIYSSQYDAQMATLPYNIIADGSKLSAMYIDEKNGYLYAFSFSTSAHGLYRIALANVESAKGNMSNWELIDNSLASSENPLYNTDEGVYVRQISGDGEYIYWSYIADETSGNKSGIKRVNATGTPKVEYVIEDVEAYGFALVPKTNISGIESIECKASDNIISIAGNSITVHADVQISIYDINGAMQSFNELSAGDQLTLNLNSGVYIVKAIATDGPAQFAKIAIK